MSHEKLSHDLSKSLITASYRKNKLDPDKTHFVIDKLCGRYGQEEVYKALEWYISQAGTKYSVHITNLRDLERKFPKILKNSKSHIIEEEADQNIIVGIYNPKPLENAAIEVLNAVGNPIGLDPNIGLNVAKHTLLGIVDLQNRMHAVFHDPDKYGLNRDTTTYRCLSHIRDKHLDPMMFAHSWMEKIKHLLLKDKLNIKRICPYMGLCPMLEQMMREESKLYCGDESEWVSIKFYLGKVQ